jgi:hypothetical protein
MDVFLGDNTGGMTAVTTHLIEQHQYQRLCFLAGPPDAPDAAERRLAFEQAVAASPGSAITQVIHGDFSEDSGIAAARTLLSRKPLPQAVVCANDQMAIGALRELQQAGVRVPADVAITGFDDVHASRVIDPPLTTVSQPFRDLGSQATRRLLTRIDEPSLPPAVEVLPTQAVIRASCGCPPRQQRLGRYAACSRKEILHAKPPLHTDVAGDQSMGGTEWEEKETATRGRGRRGARARPRGGASGGRRGGAAGLGHHRPGTAVGLDHRVQRQLLRCGRHRGGLQLDV